jgi:uncharacterized protein with PIN domain
MRFIADTMLGTLARWLRILGFDTLYVKNLEDNEIVLLAKEESRILLSRDRELCARVPGSILVDDIVLESQIRQVLALHTVNPEEILTRCLECNSVLANVPKENVSGRVPEHAYETHEEFWECCGCDKIYWKGTHFRRMKAEVERLMSQCVS